MVYSVRKHYISKRVDLQDKYKDFIGRIIFDLDQAGVIDEVSECVTIHEFGKRVRGVHEDSVEKTRESGNNMIQNSAPIRPNLVQPKAPTDPIDVAERAKKCVDGIDSIAGLFSQIKNFSDCPLKCMAINTVVPSCPESVSVMVVTDSPSSDDDVNGQILSGEAGELFDKILQSVGMSRHCDVAIYPLVFWRPAGNRSPNDAELSMLRPFFEKTVDLLRPKIIITLGQVAMSNVLGTKTTLSKGHGVLSEVEISGHKCQVMPIFHPAYLLMNPGDKKVLWSDMQALDSWLKSWVDNDA